MTETLKMEQPIDSKIFKKPVMDQWQYVSIKIIRLLHLKCLDEIKFFLSGFPEWRLFMNNLVKLHIVLSFFLDVV